MKTVVFLEHRGGALTMGSRRVLWKARAACGTVAGIAIGSDLHGEAQESGASPVFVADNASLTGPSLESHVEVLASLRELGYGTFLFAQSALGADLAAGLAAKCGAGVNWDLIDLTVDGGELIGTRSAVSGTVHAEVGWATEVRVGTFLAGALDSAPLGSAGDVVTRQLDPPEKEPQVELIERVDLPHAGPSLEDATIVVAAGGGVGGPDGYAAVEDLAAALGGAVAASSVPVGAGWAPPGALVGMSGKRVAPRLYLALGISGATQHTIGMHASRTVVAVNTDPTAPIFERSDLGVVGDLHTIVPALAKLVREREKKP